MKENNKNILILGGCGYIGSVLVPKVLSRGHSVTVIDLMIYGENNIEKHEKLNVIKGDINEYDLVYKHLKNKDCIINLATITDDPIIPELELIRKKTNLDACFNLGKMAKEFGVKNFIYASSASVYGDCKDIIINESANISALSDYAVFKIECENYLLSLNDPNFCVTCVRPSTVFGYSPRQRFDLIVNNMILNSVLKKEIPIYGKNKIRPNVHIEDITNFYQLLITTPTEIISGQIFNVAYNNFSVEELANKVALTLGISVKNIFSQTLDERSYKISSEKAKKMLNFYDQFTIEDAVKKIAQNLWENKYNDPLNNNVYYNRIKKSYNLK